MFNTKTHSRSSGFGGPAGHALEHATATAERFEASLDLLHVVPNPYLDDPAGLYLPLPPTYFNELVNDAQKTAWQRSGNGRSGTVQRTNDRQSRWPRRPDRGVRAGRIDRLDCDGHTHGRSSVAHLFLGSVAERVVRTAPCPVLTVR